MSFVLSFGRFARPRIELIDTKIFRVVLGPVSLLMLRSDADYYFGQWLLELASRDT